MKTMKADGIRGRSDDWQRNGWAVKIIKSFLCLYLFIWDKRGRRGLSVQHTKTKISHNNAWIIFCLAQSFHGLICPQPLAKDLLIGSWNPLQWHSFFCKVVKYDLQFLFVTTHFPIWEIFFKHVVFSMKVKTMIELTETEIKGFWRKRKQQKWPFLEQNSQMA